MLGIKKNITILVLLIILIMVLVTIPLEKIKSRLKNNYIPLSLIRTQIERVVNFEISFSMVQNLLHIPFFALLSFLWMRLFNKKRITFKSSILFALLITLFFSVFEEVGQIFIIARDASVLDLFLNFVGSLIGVGAYALLAQNQISPKAIDYD